MKRRTPRGIWALRAVTITVAVVVIVVAGSVFYSAYEDFQSIRSELAGCSSTPCGIATTRGTSATVTLNITIPNSGFYTLDVTVACNTTNPNFVCSAGHVSVPPGQRQVLRFSMTIVNVQQYQSSADHRINGSVVASFDPFVRIAVGVDLGSLVKTGGP